MVMRFVGDGDLPLHDRAEAERSVQSEWPGDGESGMAPWIEL